MLTQTPVSLVNAVICLPSPVIRQSDGKDILYLGVGGDPYGCGSKQDYEMFYRTDGSPRWHLAIE